jgi:hypothetical protein
VDENGCPVLFEPGTKTLILKGVTFATGKSDLTPESQEALKPVAASLAARPDGAGGSAGPHRQHGVACSEHAAFTRPGPTRWRSSWKRTACRRPSSRSEGYGSDKPIASNKTKDGRAQNRRVELGSDPVVRRRRARRKGGGRKPTAFSRPIRAPGAFRDAAQVVRLSCRLISIPAAITRLERLGGPPFVARMLDLFLRDAPPQSRRHRQPWTPTIPTPSPTGRTG